MVPCRRRARVALVSCLAVLLCTGSAWGLVCNQLPTGNTVLLGCSPLAGQCTVQSQTITGDCALDYGARKVTFAGTLDFGAGLVTVRAGEIAVSGSLLGRSLAGAAPGGRLALTATTGPLGVTGKIDVSGNAGGVVELVAEAGAVTVAGALTATGKDNATPNAADGGGVSVRAASAIAQTGEIRVEGGADASGGVVLMQAGTNLTVGARIFTTGGGSDGGEVTLEAGDDVTITHPIDASSTTLGGSGGAIDARAGHDALGGIRAGGALAVQADLTTRGSTEGGGEDASGGDGGDVTLTALGAVSVSGRVDATGAAPDGGGGELAIESHDGDPRLTALDGDLVVTGAMVLRGAGDGDGGEAVLRAGRDLRIAGTAFDLTGGSGGGTLEAAAGRHLDVASAVDAQGRLREGSGGSIDLKAGQEDVGTLAVGARLDANGGAAGAGGDLTLAGCRLTTASNVIVNGTAGTGGGTPRIDLAATRALTLGASSRYLAGPNGTVSVVRPAAVTPSVGAGVVFTPARTDVVIETSTLFPACPECGDGVRQAGEVCDRGAGADGACCNATCTAFVCPTATATATPSATATPTTTATPRTATSTRTPTATPTAGTGSTTTAGGGGTGTPTAAAPTATSATPGATATAGATVTAAATVTPTSTPAGTGSAAATPSATPSASPLATGSGAGTPAPTPTAATPTPVPEPTAVLPFVEPRAIIRCERTLGRATGKLVDADIAALQTCALQAFTCVERHTAGPEREHCLARAERRCERRQRRVTRARAAFTDAFVTDCAGLELAALRAADVLAFESLETLCIDEIGLDLSSPAAIAACVQLAGVCRAERALAAGIPHVGELLRAVLDVDALGVCVPAPDGGHETFAGGALARDRERCQRALARGGHQVLRRTLGTLRTCVDALFRCRVQGGSAEECAGAARSCGARLAKLGRARARTVERMLDTCGRLAPDDLRDATGLGLGAPDSPCAAAGDLRVLLTCVVRTYGCAGAAVLRHALPMLDDELARAGLAPDPFCAPQ